MTPRRPLPVLSADGERRQARLRDARLAVVTDARRETGDLEAFLDACAAASADLLLLRDKTATEAQLRGAADVFRSVADRHGALFVLNDLPGLAVAVGADGVHVGQHDVHPDHARRIGGPDMLIGRTIHDPHQLDVCGDEDVDYLAVGPVLATWSAATPPPGGLELIRYAARHASHPWFAVGGLTPDSAGEVLDAGARRVAVAEPVTNADDVAAVTWSLRRVLAPHH